MSLFSSVVDAWVTELQTNVTGLDSALIPALRVHRYAPWSPEQFDGERGERHLAVYPQTESEAVEPLLTDGTKLAFQTYTILVWEDASDEVTRGYDDDTANLAWLTLYEAIRARLFELDNIALGSSEIMDTAYAGGEFGVSGPYRYMFLNVRVRVPLLVT
jgi:hypothetical protein